MKVNKQFAPVTITLEYEEEVSLVIEILRRAKNDYLRSAGNWLSGHKYTDSFVQKCNYLENRLA